MKVFTPGSDDIKTKLSELYKTRAIFSQIKILPIPKIKMKEKTKLKTVEEIPLGELESQILVEGWCVKMFASTFDIWHFFHFFKVQKKRNQLFHNGFSKPQLGLSLKGLSFKRKKYRGTKYRGKIYFRPAILTNEKKIQFLNMAVFKKAHLLIV